MLSVNKISFSGIELSATRVTLDKNGKPDSTEHVHLTNDPKVSTDDSKLQILPAGQNAAYVKIQYCDENKQWKNLEGKDYFYSPNSIKIERINKNSSLTINAPGSYRMGVIRDNADITLNHQNDKYDFEGNPVPQKQPSAHVDNMVGNGITVTMEKGTSLKVDKQSPDKDGNKGPFLLSIGDILEEKYGDNIDITG